MTTTTPADTNDRDDDLTGTSADAMDQLAELIDDWDQSREGWRAIRSKAYDLWDAGVEEGRQRLEHAEKTAALHAYELGVAEGRRQAAEAIRAADTSGWPGGRGGDVDDCQDLAAKVAEAGRRQATEERTGPAGGIGARCVTCTRLIGESEAFAVVDGCGHRLCAVHQNDDHTCKVPHG
jgi:hypothetical protein